VASPEIADKLLRDIDRAAQRLGHRPQMGRSRDEVLAGLRSVLVHPYTIFYRVTGLSVEVVRVPHERRDFSTILAKDER
jgi:toxin ParE1/3/4